METIPPSYENATMRDALSLIAHYIPSADLCAASLVCRRWHAIFIPHLWGDPASHFGTENDAVYVALTRFRRTLKLARLEVRALTHTLHLPPALSEIYGGPRPEWLRDLLDSLPRLQSLIVSKLPFFDHNATITLKVPSDPEQASRYPSYNLRLLLAEKEPNTTSVGIAHALFRFPALVYLDLSYTSPAKDRLVLSTLRGLPDLQVLKLRGIGLKDGDAEVLANAIGARVRFLDIRNNNLTDMAVRSLMQACFLPETAVREQISAAARRGIDCVSEYTSKILRRPNLDKKFLEFLTQPLTGRSLFENLPHVGITHLYISDNQLTIEGVAGLLASKRLHLLDVGTVDTARLFRRSQNILSPTDQNNNVYLFPGAEKLTPIIGIYAKANLTYLRLHHAVVTKDAPFKDDISLSDLLPEMPAEELEINHFYTELDGTSGEIHELPGDALGIHELADTSVSQPVQPPISTSIHKQYPDDPLPPPQGSAFAPEVVVGSYTSSSNEAQFDVDNKDTPMSFATLRSQKIQELLAKRPRNKVLPLRRGDAAFNYLHPSHMPHVETLILTDVPSHVPANSPIIASLVRFIIACSEETLLAKIQARADYSIPPGNDRAKSEQQRAKSLFALKCLVLEITPVSADTEAKKPRTWWSQQSEHTDWKSTTGDVDSERLYSAAMEDFSFFGNEECGIPDIPEQGMANSFPMAVLNEKVHLISDDESIHSGLSELEAPNTSHDLSRKRSPNVPSPLVSPALLSPPLGTLSIDSNEPKSSSSPRSSSHNNVPDPRSVPDEEPRVDLVLTLAKFRRTKKTEFEEAQIADRKRCRGIRMAGLSSPLSSPSIPSPPSTPTLPQTLPLHVEGHWPGEVKIVRNAQPKGRSGVVDIYGNYFEKGYLYP
ncbi:leucine rich repeat domain protein [Talaromyces proteolyticus]|uniref:Leucine rich repeat domain protein n=1 Tax=Talaromyces proteolyticus TaxID=1131652 RepID=A0AAD4Q002_9EURO|nr:leucine rich repeat domain protein [Talaromyces proteolyticus]KAH8697142.1 leucine rich repeat domain protein [Talaromyces proteolyticus]